MQAEILKCLKRWRWCSISVYALRWVLLNSSYAFGGLQRLETEKEIEVISANTNTNRRGGLKPYGGLYCDLLEWLHGHKLSTKY